MGRSRAPEHVTRWLGSVHDDDLAMSVLSAGEIRRGIELIRARDPLAAGALDARLAELLRRLSARLIGVDGAIAERWCRIAAGPEPVPAIDGLIAATAIEHGLAVVTRNERDFTRFGVPVVNPWSES
jgi:toxin FitB